MLSWAADTNYLQSFFISLPSRTLSPTPSSLYDSLPGLASALAISLLIMIMVWYESSANTKIERCYVNQPSNTCLANFHTSEYIYK